MPSLVFTDSSTSWHNGGDFPATTLTKVSWDSAPDAAIAWIFFGHVNIDFDGSPTAYGPDGISPTPDDYLTNAGLPLPSKPDPSAHWYGLLALAPTDPLVTAGTVLIDTNPALQLQGKFPVIQQEKNGDPNPGFYVSTLPQPSGAPYLQNSYIDASQVAFGALASGFQALGVSLGDYGLAIRHDSNLQSGFYYVDTGYGNKLGECSHKAGKNLGGSGRGDGFNNNFPVSFIVFPGSTTSDPAALRSIADDEIKTALQPLLANLSTADNAADLVLLMGFNEVQPRNTPKGTSKLQAYKAAPTNPKPKHAGTILQGLQAFGYTTTIAMSDDPSGDDDTSQTADGTATDGSQTAVASTDSTSDPASSADSSASSADSSASTADPASSSTSSTASTTSDSSGTAVATADPAPSPDPGASSTQPAPSDSSSTPAPDPAATV